MVAPTTTREEYRKLFGDLKAIETSDVPGNELAMLSKYMVNILADFKYDEEPLRPEATKLLRERCTKFGRAVK